MSKGKFEAREGASLVAIIADEDTVTGFLLAGVGHTNTSREPNFLVVTNKTPQSVIEDHFKKFLRREDISVILISQFVANDIRHLLDEYDAIIPAILEIPSKDHPYDKTKDSLMNRVKRLTGRDD
eukprot:TRINITY_DN1419_c0_g1_i1.p1 TRINITY_DN1419_c0_g1~~TRINITY_DN1419_c0_g1_i1.p1  ORF type:complete len:125 (-),score=10.99 TRINITY_DN1419_c0_g1_i1:52-426(-)